MTPTPAIRTVIYPVSDLEQAKAVFGAIVGAAPVMDQPYYVQFTADGQEIGLDPNGAGKGMTGPVAYWHVSDIRGTLDQLVAAGAKEQQGVQDVGGGRLIATLSDVDGNPIGLIQPA
ncbi:MAG TPA: VOC family protein [Acidimicrobiales bacterium]|jgi:predicted enzyme related to lactoylglutathione lyase|nr:VOC family protein [Acidimicrobiales bacterium]